MACSNFASIFPVVIEILRIKDSILVSNQSIGGNICGIEFDLDFDILGDGNERARELFQQDLSCFGVGVDECVVSIPFPADLLEHCIVVVTHSKSQNGQVDTVFCLPLNQIN